MLIEMVVCIVCIHIVNGLLMLELILQCHRVIFMEAQLSQSN